MTKSAPLSIGLVGFGKFSRFLLTSLADHPLARVRAVYDPHLGPAQPPELTADIHVHTTLEDMVSDPTIDAVHIVTPPATHAALAVAALKAGKHVVVEKPLALTGADAQGIIDTARAHQRILAVNYVLRYNPLLQAFRALIAQQLFGSLLWLRLENVATHVAPDNHWFWDLTQSGGIHLEHGVHFFDAASFLLGVSPIRSDGELVFRGKKNTEAFARAFFSNGSLGIFNHGFLTTRQASHTTWLIVWERGRAIIEGWTPIRAQIVATATPAEISALQQCGFSIRRQGDDGAVHAERVIAEAQDPPYAAAIRDLWTDMVDAIRQGIPATLPAAADLVATVDLAWRVSQRQVRVAD